MQAKAVVPAQLLSQNWEKQIREVKMQRNTVILAHTYQPPEILALADIRGDSFALAQAARQVGESRVIMCGVRFMAETVKILSPDKEVLLAAPDAGCPMALQIEPERIARFKQANPDVAVVAYVNTTAELKAEADICVTSSSAVAIVRSLKEKKILFVPDKNLGAYVAAQCPEKEIILWEGYCPVHNTVRPDMILALKQAHPNALVALHPECPPDTFALADLVGSTKAILDFAHSTQEDLILVTERGIWDDLRRQYPNRNLYQVEPDLLTCPDMKRVSPASLLDTLNGGGGVIIEMDEELRQQARRSIEAMLRYSG